MSLNPLVIEKMIATLNQRGIRFLLIGGANFMIRHIPLLTYDLDIWVEDTEDNLSRLGETLHELKAEWGPTEDAWEIVPTDWRWLKRQPVFCMTTPLGALDIFRDLRGLEGEFAKCFDRSVLVTLPEGTVFRALSDEDMLKSQLALAPHQQNPIKIDALKKAIADGRQS